MTISTNMDPHWIIFNDYCIHVLELPHDGPYVTDICSEIKIHFLVATVNLIIFTHIVIHNRMHTMKIVHETSYAD
jgi:hypothetical protein